jgi:hypothetical protein
MPALGSLAGDAARLIRERPVIVVGAGVVALLAMRFLGDTGDASAEEAAAASTDDGYGGGILGGSTGSLGPTYPGTVPSSGDLIDSGTVTVPPPTPTTPPTPAPQVAYLWATWRAGTYPTFGRCTEGGKPGYTKTGTLKTGGFAAEVRSLGTFPRCDTSGSAGFYLVASGAHAGAILARNSMASLTTKYR